MSSRQADHAPEFKRIPSLDGLRALSIFLVAALHTLQRFSVDHRVGFLWYALCNGGYGVFIFFVISGFLITSLLLQEQRKRGSISLRGFYLRRAFRILPPLYLYIGCVVALGLAGRLAINRMDIVSSLFFFHNLTQHSTMWAVEHLWSISVEEQFYLVWPFILYLTLRKTGRDSSPAGRYSAAIFPAVVLVLSPFARVFFGRYREGLMHNVGVKYLNYDFLMFGCLIALLQNTPRFEAIYRKATRIWWLPPAVITTCSIVSARFQNYFDLPIGYTINGAAIAIFLLWCTRNPASGVGRILNWTPIVKVGVLSYSIYLWQTLFLHRRNVEVFGSFRLISTFPGNWLAFFLAACLSYYAVEQPSLRLRSRLFRTLHLYDAGPQASTLTIE
jgi:peptidoglycan/LPS O-acetylase OafA/YrhL